MISEARKHKIRLILSLCNNWKDYGGKACWGLDLRVKPSPSEMLPNLFAGLQRNGAKRTRKYRMNAERRKLEDHDLRSEGYHLPKAEGNG